MGRFQNLVGMKYNKWLVLSYVGGRDHKWLCRCECGKEKEVVGIQLRKNKSKQCKSCADKQQTTDLKGKLFGDWTVLEYSGSSLWLCQCKCNQIKNIESDNLISGKSTKCRRCGGRSHPLSYLFKTTQRRAKRRKIKFSMSMQYAISIYDKQNGKCALTGLEIPIFESSTEHIRPLGSIDRIDSSKGYEEGNIQFVHKDINIMKWNLSMDKFVDYCKLVIKNTN